MVIFLLSAISSAHTKEALAVGVDANLTMFAKT
jgi:hypothetical protein